MLPVIGDLLYNYRSALDHLAYQLVLKAGAVPSSRTQFPIFNDPDVFERESPRQTSGMSDPMLKLVRYHQPCFGPNQFANEALFALHEYGNIDKHRRLLVHVTALGGVLWDPPGPAAFVHDGPVEDGTTLARFPPGYHKQTVWLIPAIAFGEGAAAGKDIQRVLGLLELRVPRILDEFEAAFFA